MTRQVTERDLRMPEFADADPKDLEFRGDGKLVRKDRWEIGIRKIYSRLGMSSRGDDFEIENVVAGVTSLVARCQLMDDAIGDVLWEEMRANIPILWPTVSWLRGTTGSVVPVPGGQWQRYLVPSEPAKVYSSQDIDKTLAAAKFVYASDPLGLQVIDYIEAHLHFSKEKS